ncbi:hypothetical protein [Nocardioides sp. B-3]|uniref:hypothetical protein n=1 Tax=Nocardioides sp. B-3 TaxID=2895565 RepID=UPI002152A69B|nr:hypothetical protein [Nocardioides sp. B-3]UUZ59788.1 hypothetical protein LP418_01415 [Nocardioides sp. B-3]
MAGGHQRRQRRHAAHRAGQARRHGHAAQARRPLLRAGRLRERPLLRARRSRQPQGRAGPGLLLAHRQAQDREGLRQLPRRDRHGRPAGAAVHWTTGDTGIKSWDTTTGGVTKLSRRPANPVDIGNDLPASYTKDPYMDGCMVVSRLSDPSDRLWKSCTERVAAFSPDGDRIATVHILSDGIGPGEVWERELDGTLLGDYTTSWFGRIAFEDDTDLLLEVNGDTQSATVRCSEGSCANATDPVAVQEPRVSPRVSSERPSQRFGSVGAAAGARQTPQS